MAEARDRSHTSRMLMAAASYSHSVKERLGDPFCQARKATGLPDARAFFWSDADGSGKIEKEEIAVRNTRTGGRAFVDGRLLRKSP